MRHQIDFNDVILNVDFEPYFTEELDYMTYSAYSESINEYYKTVIDYIEIEAVWYEDKLGFDREIKNISDKHEQEIIEVLKKEEECWIERMS